MISFIINPSSKSGQGIKTWRIVEEKLKAASVEYKVYMTSSPGSAMRIARKISDEGAEIVIMGGDGTVNEVISGLRDPDKVTLGYIPTGSGNDFARDLDFDKDLDLLIDSIIKNKVVRNLDLGELTYNTHTNTLSRLHNDELTNKRAFGVSSGIGFDAAVCEAALASYTKNILNKLGLGKMTYGAIALRQLFTAPKIPCDIEIDDTRTIHFNRFLFIAAMNHHYEGGGFKFAPDAILDDGLMNICIIGDLPRPLMLIALPFAYFGHYYRFPGIHHFTAAKLHVKTGSPMWVHTDGEVSMQSDDITLKCHKQKLHFVM